MTGQFFSFKAAATSTGLVTVQFGFLGSLPLYLPNGFQATLNDIQGGILYLVKYDHTLNSGNGGFQIPAIPTAKSPADVQVFTAAGANTWTAPSGINSVWVFMVAAGGGGGGNRQNAGTTKVEAAVVVAVLSRSFSRRPTLGRHRPSR